MPKKSVGNGGAGIFVAAAYFAGDLEQLQKRSHKVIVALTVKEILDEQIARKLV